MLVGCVETKLGHGALAKDLYVSDYFFKMRTFAEASEAPWFILSAEHGLVDPDAWLEPYNVYLPNTPRDYRLEWGAKVARQLQAAVGDLHEMTVEIHAGGPYVEAVREPLESLGAAVIDRLAGLSFGNRLSWYLNQQGDEVQDDVLTQLRDATRALTLADFLASGGTGLRSPGMYSWWVEEAGAADLSGGLGHEIAPGLIYAGLAGATRSGGSTSTNTLWGRIATMHLGKNYKLSTLRLSVGSILASAYRLAAIDEEQLTRWMHAHLRVVPVPVLDADTLDGLESEILRELDPPLNLAKVERTPLRQRLSALRKQYGGAGEQ